MVDTTAAMSPRDIAAVVFEGDGNIARLGSTHPLMGTARQVGSGSCGDPAIPAVSVSVCGGGGALRRHGCSKRRAAGHGYRSSRWGKSHAPPSPIEGEGAAPKVKNLGNETNFAGRVAQM